MAHKIITAPASEPVSLDSAKLNSRVDGVLEDSWFTDAIQSAREQAEHRTGRAFINRTIEFVLDAFPTDGILVPISPVGSIVSVKYIDSLGVETTISSGEYTLDNYGLKQWILPVTEWPVAYDGANAVKIQVIAGYGATDASVPASIKSWIKLAVDANYKHRGALTDGQAYQLPHDFCNGLLDPVKAWSL
jgi:uncharacterized phiE125 gp8 family phage protein